MNLMTSSARKISGLMRIWELMIKYYSHVCNETRKQRSRSSSSSLFSAACSSASNADNFGGSFCSSLGDSTLGDSTLGDSTLDDSTLGDSTLGDSTLDDSTLGDSTLGDSTFLGVSTFFSFFGFGTTARGAGFLGSRSLQIMQSFHSHIG